MVYACLRDDRGPGQKPGAAQMHQRVIQSGGGVNFSFG